MTDDISGKMQMELADVMAKVNSWSLAREKELQTLKVDHTNFLDTHNDMTQKLKVRDKQAKARQEKNAREASKHQEALEKLSSETEQLKDMSAQLPAELQALQKQLCEEKENYEKELQALSHSDRSRAQKQSSLESGHELYQKRLSLKFERFQDGCLVIKMHNVDPASPQRQFYFSIRVEDDTNTYTVRECVPEVEGLDELVTKLNESNCLSSFVRGIRKAWRVQVLAA